MISAVKVAATPAELMFRRLSSLRPLTADDAVPIRALGHDVLLHAPAAEVTPPTGAGETRMVTSGILGEARMLSDGRRQIINLRLPGDLVSLPAAGPGAVVLALTLARTTSATPLLQALADPSPKTAALRAAWREAETLEHRAMLDHIVRLGRLSAYERTGHLLLELHERLLRVGLATALGFHLPLTQEMLADILGLSVVHMNRTMQQLRRDGLVSYRSGEVAFPDRATLAVAVGYALQVTPPAGAAMRRPQLTIA